MTDCHLAEFCTFLGMNNTPHLKKIYMYTYFAVEKQTFNALQCYRKKIMSDQFSHNFDMKLEIFTDMKGMKKG